MQQSNESTKVPLSAKEPDVRILGLSTSELAGLSVDELTGNKTAVTMVMHYYKQLVDENTGLKNERNTLSTYVSGYKTKKVHSKIGALLLAMSNICIGFGVNLLTTSTTWPGLSALAPGLVMGGLGLYFSLSDGE